MVFLCQMTLQDRIIKVVMSLYGEEPFKVSYHSVKFGGHGHFGSGV